MHWPIKICDYFSVTQIHVQCRRVKSNVHSQLLVVTKRKSPLADVSAPISRAKRGKLETGQRYVSQHCILNNKYFLSIVGSM